MKFFLTLLTLLPSVLAQVDLSKLPPSFLASDHPLALELHSRSLHSRAPPTDDFHIFATDDETPGSAGDWVVIVDDSDPRTPDQLIKDLGGDPEQIVTRYDNTAFKGFAAHMSKHCANKLGAYTHDRKGIKAFEPMMNFTAAKAVTSTRATWGLERVSTDGKVERDIGQGIGSRTYSYTSDDSAGEGVDVYVIDTGVNINHVEFGGRARMGFVADFANPADRNPQDENGHGTHCAGTVAGKTLGVAPKANIIGVKVLGGSGGGSNSGIIAGVEYIVDEHVKRRKTGNFKGSIMSMSLGSDGASPAFDSVIEAAAQAGIHVIIAAGNSAVDACTASPAGQLDRKPDTTIISVGASTIDDQRADFSNFGKCISVYAPGEDVTSAWITVLGRNNIVNTISGTSMACPHVAGIVAYYLGLNQKLKEDTAAMKRLIVQSSEKVRFADRIAGDPEIIAGMTGTVNGGKFEPEGPATPPAAGGDKPSGGVLGGVRDALKDLLGGGHRGRVRREEKLVHIADLQ